MYHRFNEEKYPSTNIQMDIFLDQIKIIKDLNYNFYNPGDLEKNYDVPKKEKKILITIDDAFSSFYEFAWPYLKDNKIPFILFVSHILTLYDRICNKILHYNKFIFEN